MNVIIKSKMCNKHHFLLSIALSGVVLAFKELNLIKSVGTCAVYLVFVNVNMDRYAKTDVSGERNHSQQGWEGEWRLGLGTGTEGQGYFRKF